MPLCRRTFSVFSGFVQLNSIKINSIKINSKKKRGLRPPHPPFWYGLSTSFFWAANTRRESPPWFKGAAQWLFYEFLTLNLSGARSQWVGYTRLRLKCILNPFSCQKKWRFSHSMLGQVTGKAWKSKWPLKWLFYGFLTLNLSGARSDWVGYTRLRLKCVLNHFFCQKEWRFSQ